MNRVREAAEDWQAAAIEKCRNDPEFMARGLCPECVCLPPCMCADDNTRTEMRAEFNRIMHANPFPQGGIRWRWFERVSRAFKSREPKVIGSWGAEHDGLMRSLYKIAVKRHEEEISRLRKAGGGGQ